MKESNQVGTQAILWIIAGQLFYQNNNIICSVSASALAFICFTYATLLTSKGK